LSVRVEISPDVGDFPTGVGGYVGERHDAAWVLWVVRQRQSSLVFGDVPRADLPCVSQLLVGRGLCEGVSVRLGRLPAMSVRRVTCLIHVLSGFHPSPVVPNSD